VIPATGYETRLFPATKAVKKELFPIVDRQGRAKPLILAIVEEALSGGIESLGQTLTQLEDPIRGRPVTPSCLSHSEPGKSPGSVMQPRDLVG
jgi:hypothetical protein